MRIREDAAVRRAKIIEQALRIVGEFGYYGFTIQELASRCDISNAGLLYYFGTKDKLLLALLDEIEQRVEERVAPLVTAASSDCQSRQDSYEATVAVITAMVRHLLDNVTITRFVAALQLESIHPDHPAHGWFRDREDEALAFMRQLTAPWTSEPVSVARQLHALMQGLGQQWLRAGQNFDLVGEWEKAFRAILPPPVT